MPTLAPGVHDPSEAPWWEFHCEDCATVVAQWMSHAARDISQQVINRAAGGYVHSVEVLFTSLDGMSGHYRCRAKLHPGRWWYFTVSRGNQVSVPTTH
jgi:hypothetical protein